MHAHKTISILAIVSTLLGGALAETMTDQQRAEQILTSAGVKGGLIVHLGCGDGQLTAALRAADSYLVHGLDADAADIAEARKHIMSIGQYGGISVERWSADTLPYIDNTVNLIVCEMPDIAESEMMRVLVPNGVACIRSSDGWTKKTKPRPSRMDEWTHYLHSPNGNAVSRDELVDHLSRMQWVGGPRYGRHHDHMSSASAMVSAAGRLFYIFDHASPFSIQLPSKWQLVARDAFNGTVLWRREVGPWFSQMQRLKSGPSNLPRRLVAIDDTVYVTLAWRAPLTALNAATGETKKTYEGTNGTDEILYSDGTLFLVVNREGHSREPFTEWTRQERTIMALDADTGDISWERTWPWVIPGGMAVDHSRVVFYDGERIAALDRKTGEPLWRSEKMGRRSPVPVYFSPCLVLYDNKVLFSGSDPDTSSYHADNGKTMYALSAESGEILWRQPHAPSGYRSAEDILVINDLVWTADIFNSRDLRTDQTGTVWGRDPKTGEVKVQFKPDVDTHWFHHRCYRAKATTNYLLTSRTGIEFVDFRKEHWTCHHWVRGACLYGIMPANGLVYAPPHPCACYLEAKLYGFTALAPRSSAHEQILKQAKRNARLERGPAYNTTAPNAAAKPSEWPMLRADVARSGKVATQVPTDLEARWKTDLGGKLSSPVLADGKLYLASVNTHTIHAMDADSGRSLWAFTAGARVDSPPTIWRKRAYFGSADGYVYCLRASDGEMIWRYRAAPADLRMGAFDQIESVWPVHGSVLIRHGDTEKPELWCAAGRSMFLDGGLRLLRLDPLTGRLIDEKTLDDRVPGTHKNLQAAIQGLNMPVALPDVLVDDGKFVYMRSQQFDGQGNRIDIDIPTRNAREQKGETTHLFCPTGLLDDIWWHRSYWVFGRVWKSGAGGYYQSGRFAPAGRPMVFDDKRVYGFGRKPQYYRWTTPMEYMLFASPKQPPVVKIAKDKRKGLGSMPPTAFHTDWRQDLPILVRAMVLADDTLFLAGPEDLFDEHKTLNSLDADGTQKLLARQAAALQGRRGAVLRAVSIADGSKLSEQKLDDVPTFDGMIAANGRLYYTTVNGRVVCLAAGEQTKFASN